MPETLEAKLAAAGAQPPPLKISRTFHARRATVFKAWTTSEHVKAFFSPTHYEVGEARIDPRVGGAFEYSMGPIGGPYLWSHGQFVEVVADERLAFELRVNDPTGAALFHARTEIDFADVLGGTRLDIIQTYVFANPAMAAPMVAGASEGWRTTLDKLEAHVVAMQGGVGVETRSVVHAIFHLERTYAAPVARIWKALTDPAAKGKWFGGPPGTWELLERHMDVRPGGRERLSGRWDGGVVSTFDATYYDVIENERLVYAYEMHMGEKKISVSLATFQLKTAGGKTTLLVTEQGAFLDGYDDAGSREHGTGQLLDLLGASLAD